MAELTRAPSPPRAPPVSGSCSARPPRTPSTALSGSRALARSPPPAPRRTGRHRRGHRPYSRLSAGPGWPLVVRSDLATPKSGRDDRRRALSAFVQFTDLHITDAESPARFEYLHPFIGSAHRPQEALGTVATSALVERVNSVRQGPFTGRPFDLMVTTGDNTDNHELIELDWFLKVLNGGTVTPNSGDANAYEGVQSSGNDEYWNPSIPGVGDDYSAKGFPQLPGLLEAGIKSFTAPGLDVPWFCTFGNHDDSIVGSLPAQIPGSTPGTPGGTR